MCGILAILGLPDAPAFRKRAIELQKKLRHRGPDWSGIHCSKSNIICHERLAIVDPESGDQPLYARADDSLVLGVNGEIYNHQALEEAFFGASSEELKLRRNLQNSLSAPPRKEDDHCPRTGSDCEILLHQYKRDGKAFLDKNEVCGMFACVLLDERTGHFVVARDAVGIIPLYYGRGKDGSFWVASEMKVLADGDCATFQEFPPGMVYDSETKEFKPYLLRPGMMRGKSCEDGGVKGNCSAGHCWFLEDHKKLESYPVAPTKKIDAKELRVAFEAAVQTGISYIISVSRWRY